MALHYEYQIRLKKFRGFSDTDWVDIKPLTVVLGANNSGKSSLIAPMLLMKQTASSSDSVTPLVTRGKQIDIGFYADYAHKHDTSIDFEIGFRYHTHAKPKEKLKPLGKYPPGAIEVQFGHGGYGEDVILKSYSIFDIYRRKMLSLERSGDEFLLDQLTNKNIDEHELDAIQNSQPINFLFSSSSALYSLQRSVNSKNTKKTKNDKEKDKVFAPEDYSDGFKQYLAASSYSYEEMRAVIASTFHIGPHRQQPKRVYEYLGDKPSSVGKEGEYFASILKRDQDQVLDKVNLWMRKLELGGSLEIDELSDDLFSLLISQMGKRDRYNVADLGFGLSQVLPIVVQLLTVAKDSITIIEQPELHLNPRLQRNLADLFVSAAKEDKRVFIETHSEHLILRLRTLVAQKKLKPDDLAIYYVERHGKFSRLRKIPVDQLGHIDTDDWPKGFFADNLQGSLELAQSQRKALSNAK